MSKRIKDLATPFTKVRKTIAGYALRPFEALSENQKFWLGFALLCILTTLLINNPFWRSAPGEQYKEGDIARESIISPADITVTDTEETERLRQISRDSVQPIFTSSGNRADEAVQSFRSSWESLRRTSETANTNDNTRRSNKIGCTMERRGRRMSAKSLPLAISAKMNRIRDQSFTRNRVGFDFR